jgi:pimeloyl-ACP methyl ester carboxylesterase
MRERAVKFGAASNLVGVLTEPDPVAAREERPGVIFLNSGILHHAGASRLYVKIARKLASSGFFCLRFDFAGVGDSEPRRDTLPFARGAVEDAREAMDFLQSARGIRRFILVGLCSGADMAYHVALADNRVAGLAKLDAWVYSTRRAVVRHYVPRVLSLRQWRHSIRVRLEGRRARAGQSPQDPSASLYVAPEYRRKFPPREEVEDGLRRLTERGVRLYYFFSGDQISVFNYREQYRDSFPDVDFRDLLTVDFQPDSDHTVTGLRHQEEVTDAIHRWAVAGWGHPATEQAAASEAVLSGTARGD